jgi:hypothetical protein
VSVGDEAIISVQNPARLNEYTEPQPDLAVIRPRDYRESYRIRVNGARNVTPPPPGATSGSW